MSYKQISLASAVYFCILCLLSPPLAAQAPTSVRVSGTVQSPEGSVIAGAGVTMTNLDFNQAQTTTTDNQGRFRFPALAVGEYELKIEDEGFAPWQQRLRLAVGAALDLPITLNIEHSESIIVTGDMPVIETARVQVASSVSPREVRELPLNGRNYLDLALLAPGVSRTNTGANQRFAETSAVPGTGISVSTQRNLANSFIVDGLSANDDAAELAGTFFSQEVIREFAVVRAGGVAEFGRSSAGIINIVTSSGANTMRGGAYGFFRNDSFDSKNAISNTKLPLDQKQYGATLGGALIRDRTFYFTNFEQMRQDSGVLVTIAPASVAAINAKLDEVGFKGPRIGTGAFDASLDTTNAFARIDHAFTPSNQLTLRVNTYDVESDNARSVGGLNDVSRATGLTNEDRTLAVSNLWTVSDRMLSETRAQVTRSRLDAPPNDTTGPAITISGVANLGTATSSPTARDIDLGEVVQNFSWMRGNHSVKAGMSLLRNRVDIGFPGAVQGVYSFSSLTNFLAGRYSSYQQAVGNESTRQTNDNLGTFVQDEWRVGMRLTVNAGLRYDQQRYSDLINTDNDNVSPRIGAAWDVRGDGRSVLRGSAGIYYAPIPLRAVANALQRDGVHYRVIQVGPTAPGAPTFPNVFTTLPANVLTNITTIDPDIQNSSSTQAAVQYEQQLGGSTFASVAYEHLRGEDIIMSRNVNVPTTTDPTVPNLGRPDPRFANNSQYQSIGDSWYDGLTLALNRRQGSWGNFRLSYTYSKGFDTSGNFFFSQPQNANDVAAERGRSDNDQRHRLTLSGTLAARTAGGDSLVRRLAQGWQLSYVFTYTSALPFNIQLPNDRNGDTNFNDRPLGVGRNAGEGFDYKSLDLRLSRTFSLTQDLSLEAIVDVFNVLDRANYQVPNNIFTSPTFGQPTATNDPRQFQLGLRLFF
jgi:outer membrane receptor protein involved in Fe transport